jgi:AraC family transcriptional regulator of adaptative response/methylated-DNA-[protein]-cysteine methyltransferase
MNEDLFWQASATRDSRFDGVFFLCVKTTKIYCKPSCSARQPNRSNVEFALTCADAESRGFRACLRCKPQNPINENPVGRMIADACAMLEDDELIKLAELSAKLGVSPFHLQRTFKEVIGVSPKKIFGNAPIGKVQKRVAGWQRSYLGALRKRVWVEQQTL